MPAPAHVQAATINKLIQGWKDWTPDAFLSVWADNCTQTQLPFSGKVPTRTREHVEHFFPILMSLLTNFEVCTLPEPRGSTGVVATIMHKKD